MPRKASLGFDFFSSRQQIQGARTPVPVHYQLLHD
jgi:hypothetical protein